MSNTNLHLVATGLSPTVGKPEAPSCVHSLADEFVLENEIDTLLIRLSPNGFFWLKFPKPLEIKFEADCCVERAYRMWFEGLVAITLFSACLLLDALFVRDHRWTLVVQQTVYILPLAISVNVLVQGNPPKLIRELSIATASIMICFLNLCFEGTASTSAVLFGVLCTMICGFFTGVAMRLRLEYILLCTGSMLVGTILWLHKSTALNFPEKMIATSLLTLGMGLVCVASYCLERQERRCYLLDLQTSMRAESLRSLNRQLEKISSLDALTGLLNRRALEQMLHSHWAICKKESNPISAIVIDVDCFKGINDRYGHLIGDEVIKAVAKVLRQVIRQSTDAVARFGGEEFVLILPSATSEQTFSVAERARHLVEWSTRGQASSEAIDLLPHCTVSCGVATLIPDETTMPLDLLQAADVALYAAKRAGRNRVVCAEPDATERLRVEPCAR